MRYMLILKGRNRDGYPNQKENNSCTYRDYLEWPEAERWEVIERVAYRMTPSPSRRFYKISMVYRLFENGKYGRAEVYSEEDKVKVGIFDDIIIELKEIVKD